jgi:hypothetical protein
MIVAGSVLFLSGASWADVPAPPTNQYIGFPDFSFSSLNEAECRVCHDSIDGNGTADSHHLLYETSIPEGSIVPYPDVDGIPGPDTTYGCLNCHESDPPGDFVERDCTVCHTTGLHHESSDAQDGDCVACHGDLVNNRDDGHYIPIHEPSLVTPARSLGEGLPLNSRSNGTGACDYCHDDDGLTTPIILTNANLHHGTGLGVIDTLKCLWCHELSTTGDYKIRDCERCHGPDSLHNIQVDSTNTDNIGTIVIGGEDAGFGHVGRDAGPGDSDCWGCHGFAEVSLPDPGEYPDDHPSYFVAPYGTEADCRACHEYLDTVGLVSVPDRHHVLYGTDLATRTNAPYSTLGTDIYVCLSCHGTSIALVRNCLVCHTEDIDYDSDGFTDGKERSIGTDPTDDDTDDDTILDGSDNCPLVSNVDQDNWDGDTLGDVCDADIDNDGVPSASDDCEYTELGVVVNAEGCAIEQLVPCEGPAGDTTEWKNHGEYMKYLAKESKKLVQDGVITSEERDEVMNEGSLSDCGQE